MDSYRPTVEDMTAFESQQLSCREGGKFDQRFLVTKTAPGCEPEFGCRVPKTGWAVISRQRQQQGISRKARIQAGR